VRPSELATDLLILLCGYSAASRRGSPALCSPRAGTGPAVASGLVEKSRCGSCLQRTVDVAPDAAGLHMRVACRLDRIKGRGHASIRALKQRFPMGAWPLQRKGLPNARSGVARRQDRTGPQKSGSSFKPRRNQEFRVEFRFQALHRDETAIGAGVAAAPVRPVKQALGRAASTPPPP
jgi:hypothetical protein